MLRALFFLLQLHHAPCGGDAQLPCVLLGPRGDLIPQHLVQLDCGCRIHTYCLPHPWHGRRNAEDCYTRNFIRLAKLDRPILECMGAARGRRQMPQDEESTGINTKWRLH